MTLNRVILVWDFKSGNIEITFIYFFHILPCTSTAHFPLFALMISVKEFVLFNFIHFSISKILTVKANKVFT